MSAAPGSVAQAGAAREERRGASRATSTCALGLLVLHAVLLFATSRRLECLADEGSYFNVGRVLLRHGWAHETTLYQGPLALVANQLFVGSFPAGGYQRLPEQDPLLRRGRLGTLPFALLGAGLVFLWARQAFGDAGGLLALLVHVLNPVLIGYGATLLVDVPLAALSLLAFYLLWRFLESGRAWLVPACGAALGLALATKYSALLFVPPIALSVALASGLRARALGPALVALLALGGASLLALHAGYGFQAGLAGRDPQIYATGLVRACVQAPGSGWLAALLPDPFLRGVDFQLMTSERTWDIFLDGRFTHGRPEYYAWVLLCKTPEVVLLGAAALAFRLPALLRGAAGSAARTSALALLPALALVFLYLSLFTDMQLGVRYVLPLYPPLFVLLGSLATWPPLARLPRAAGIGALALLGAGLAADLARNGPDLVAYYNASSGGQRLAYRRFRDTNGDYGQHDRAGLSELRERSPVSCATLGSRSGARFGVFAASNEDLRARDPDDPARPRFDWLTAGEPLAHVGASWWVFEATPEALERRLRAAEDPDLRADLALAYLGADRRAEAEAHLALLDPGRAEPLYELARALDAAERDDRPATRLALLRAWTEVGRADRTAELRAAQPELAATDEGIAAWLLEIEERKDVSGVMAFLETARPGPWGPALLRLVVRLKRGGPAEVLLIYERLLELVAGTPLEEAWRELPLFQEVREAMESRRRIIELLE